MKHGNLEFAVLQESFLRFDGGAMFGHVPKTVWGKIVTCDDLNRVQSSCNQLLIRMGGKNILTDPGMGLKWNEKELALYDLSVKSYEELLRPQGLKPADIDYVVLSHLHIDHAGGLTGMDMDKHLHLVFPNATVFVQKGEWESANNPDKRSVPSYREHDFVPVKEAGKLELLDGDCEILPGVRVSVTGGHTAAHQIIEFSEGDHSIFFMADIFPSGAHLKPHWAMGYDLFPLDIIAAREKYLPRLAQAKTLTMFGHDPYSPVVRIKRSPDGRYYCESLAEATQ